MLADTQRSFLCNLLLAFSLAAGWRAAAQTHAASSSAGSSSSAASYSTTVGIRAGAGSVAAAAYGYALPFLGNCCASYFGPPRHLTPPPKPPLAPVHQPATQGGLMLVPMAVPVFIPYGVADDVADGSDPGVVDPQDGSEGNVQDGSEPEVASDDPEPENDELAFSDPAPLKKQAGGRRHPKHSSKGTSEPKQENPPPAGAVEDPVIVQPTTVLVFKDGHRSDVVNYAIVGDTLFDFADGRARRILLADLDLAATQKANDELGVDFRLPPKAK